jgi:hypothetical protein
VLEDLHAHDGASCFEVEDIDGPADDSLESAGELKTFVSFQVAVGVDGDVEVAVGVVPAPGDGSKDVAESDVRESFPDAPSHLPRSLRLEPRYGWVAIFQGGTSMTMQFDSHIRR